jgi:hypothetical protein
MPSAARTCRRKFWRRPHALHGLAKRFMALLVASPWRRLVSLFEGSIPIGLWRDTSLANTREQHLSHLRPVEERFVSRKEMAEILHISLRTLDMFVAEGMPSERWGLRSRVFQPSRSIAWARARKTGKAA